MSPVRRVRHHVNPLSAAYMQRRAAGIALPEGRDVEVEVGCAEAQFLFERAERDPSGYYVGLEIRRELVDMVNRHAGQRGLPVHAELVNVNVNMDVLFPRGRVARAFVNFPDPCFKRRQRKRRVMDPRLVRDLHGALVAGGELFFQSDVFELALDAMAVLEDAPELFVNQAGPWSFWKQPNPYGARSTRETWCELQELPVWRLLYRAVP